MVYLPFELVQDFFHQQYYRTWSSCCGIELWVLKRLTSFWVLTKNQSTFFAILFCKNTDCINIYIYMLIYIYICIYIHISLSPTKKKRTLPQNPLVPWWTQEFRSSATLSSVAGACAWKDSPLMQLAQVPKTHPTAGSGDLKIGTRFWRGIKLDKEPTYGDEFLGISPYYNAWSLGWCHIMTPGVLGFWCFFRWTTSWVSDLNVTDRFDRWTVFEKGKKTGVVVGCLILLVWMANLEGDMWH